MYTVFNDGNVGLECIFCAYSSIVCEGRTRSTVGRENFARFKFRVFCNSRKFIRESLFRESLFANRNDRYTAIVAAKQ